MRIHSLVDIYRELNKEAREHTYKDKTGSNQMSRIDYFIVDQETAAYTNSAKIEEITYPFDHSQITLEIDFDKVMRGPGYWKLNNSHLENQDYIKLVELVFVEIAHQNQQDLNHPKNEFQIINFTICSEF